MYSGFDGSVGRIMFLLPRDLQTSWPRGRRCPSISQIP